MLDGERSRCRKVLRPFPLAYAWRGSAGDWPPVAVPCPASRCARLRDLKVCGPAGPARPCCLRLRAARRCAWLRAAFRPGLIRTSPLRRLRRGPPASPGARLPRRLARRFGLLAAPAPRLLRFAPAAVAAARPARLPAAPCSRLRSRGGGLRGRVPFRPSAAWWAFRPPAFCRAAARGLPLRREKRKPALRPAFRKAVN